MIAALYVATNGHYYGVADVDPWDEKRDARRYAGPYAVVAHPPCQRWGAFWAGQPLAIKKTGIRKIKGDDGGCFDHALASVRAYGGVLEHPGGSHAWEHFGLQEPTGAGWTQADEFGWTCSIEQGRYGHYARKHTWLYVCKTALPVLHWGHSEMKLDPVTVARIGLQRAKRRGEVGNRGGGTNSTVRIATPEPFRDVLLYLARSVKFSCPPL